MRRSERADKNAVNKTPSATMALLYVLMIAPKAVECSTQLMTGVPSFLLRLNID
jgi:hypothetical protein